MVKSTFGKDPTISEIFGEFEKSTPKKPFRKEKAAVWLKKTKDGEDYLAIKLIIDGQIHWANAFKKANKTKDTMPDYVAFEKEASND